MNMHWHRSMRHWQWRHWHWHRRCLRPTRFLWFLFGALAAHICHKLQERRHGRDGRLCSHDRVQRYARWQAHRNALLGHDDDNPKPPCPWSCTRRGKCDADDSPRSRVLPLPMPTTTSRGEDERQRILNGGRHALERVSTLPFPLSTAGTHLCIQRCCRWWMLRRLPSSPCLQQCAVSKL